MPQTHGQRATQLRLALSEGSSGRSFARYQIPDFQRLPGPVDLGGKCESTTHFQMQPSRRVSESVTPNVIESIEHWRGVNGMPKNKLHFREVDAEQTPDICGVAVDLINPGTIESVRSSLAVIYVEPGSKSARHYHKATEEIYYFLEGAGRVLVDVEEITVEPGSAVYLPIGKVHQVLNTSPLRLRFLSIDTPPFDPTDVFVLPDISGTRRESRV